MKITTAPYRNLARLTAVLASVALLTGCGSTKSLLGKSSDSAAAKTTELAVQDQEEPVSSDRRDVVTAGYQGDDSASDVALASAKLYDKGSVVQADGHVLRAPADPMSLHPLTGTVQHIGTDDFEQQVLNSDVPVMVDFYADWCGPCKKLSPTLDKIASETPSARVVKVNIDDSPRIAKKYGVSSIPTVMVFKNGEAVARNTGMANKSKLMGMLAQ